jgi:transcriptional regulator with XRE-family HTH domain
MRRIVRRRYVIRTFILSSMSDELQQLGGRVRQRRIDEGLSQEKLAERCGFDRTYISLVERGQRNPSFTNLLKLARGLNTDLSHLTQDL